MKPHQFWVVTATIGSYSDRRWWIVSVHVDRPEAITMRDALGREAAEFRAEHERLAAAQLQYINSVRELGRELTQEEWGVAFDQLKRAVIKLKAPMCDVRFRDFDSQNTLEVPEYLIEPGFDVPSADMRCQARCQHSERCALDLGHYVESALNCAYRTCELCP